MLATRTLQGATWLVFSRSLGRFIDFFTLLFLARVLTPADFGTVALAMTFIVIMDTLFELPVAQALVRLSDVGKSHFDTGFTLSVLRSLALALVVIAGAWPFSLAYDDPSLIPLLLALLIAPISRGLNSPKMVIFTRELSFRQTFVAEIVAKIVAFLVATTAAFWGAGYWALVVNNAAGGFVTTVMSYVLAPYRPAFSLARFADFGGFIGWFSSIQLVSALSWQFDRILLGRFVDKDTFGRYAIASDLAVFPIRSLVSPALASVMAAFAQIKSERDRLQLAFLKAARFAMLVSAPASIGIALTADLIVSVVLAPEWDAAASYLHLLALSMLSGPYHQVLYSLSLAVNRPVVVFRLSTIDLAVRVGLISAGLYFFSITGVLIARVLVSAAMFVFYLLEARRLARISLLSQFENLWKVALGSGFMTVSVLAFRHFLAPLALSNLVELVFVAIVGSLVYAAALLACGVRLTLGRGRIELSDRWW